MVRQQGLVPIGEVIADLPGPVQAIREATPQAQRHFTRCDQGGPACRGQSATALIWRLLMVAEKHFRKLNAFELLPVVYAGQKHQDGKPIQEEKMSNKRRMKRAA